MASAACEVCADRDRRHAIGGVLATLLSPVFWSWAGLTALGRRCLPHHRRPRLCLLAGSRPLRRDLTRALRRVLDELQRFETKAPLDLVVVQDRVSRPDGEPLRAAVQCTRRGSSTLLTVRLALHAHRTCYGPETVAATLADVLVTLYEREAQAAPVLEVPARVPREAPAAVAPAAPSRNATSPAPGRNGTASSGTARMQIPNGIPPARANVNDEADGTVAQFKPRPGGPSGNDPA